MELIKSRSIIYYKYNMLLMSQKNVILENLKPKVLFIENITCFHTINTVRNVILENLKSKIVFIKNIACFHTINIARHVGEECHFPQK